MPKNILSICVNFALATQLFRAAAGAKTPLFFAVYLSLSRVFSSSIKVLISLNWR